MGKAETGEDLELQPFLAHSFLDLASITAGNPSVNRISLNFELN